MVGNRSLNSEQLGHLGEQFFDMLCTRASLIANKSLRDLSGWDYKVDFKNAEASGDISLDKRANPISCLVQVKTMRHDNDRVRFRLSSLERLAKDPGPAFIFIIKMGQDLSPTEMFTIHLIGEPLSDILEALRRHELENSVPVNKTDYYLSASKHGVKFEDKGSLLDRHIKEIIQLSISDYIKMKAEELENLGYQTDRYHINMVVEAESEEKFIDSLLGRGGKLTVKEMSGVENRFGIALPMPRIAGGGVVSITPSSIQICEVIFRESRRSPAILLSGAMYWLPPPISEVLDSRVMRIDAKMVELIYRNPVLTVNCHDIVDEDYRLTISDWVKHFSILKILINGGGFLEIKMGSRSVKGQELRTAMQGMDGDLINEDLDLIIKLRHLFDFIGVPPNTKIHFSEIFNAENQIDHLTAIFIDNSTTRFQIAKFSQDKLKEFSDEMAGTYISYISIGENLIVWRCNVYTTKLEDSIKIKFMITGEPEPETSFIKKSDYLAYVETVQEKCGTSLFMATKLANFYE